MSLVIDTGTVAAGRAGIDLAARVDGPHRRATVGRRPDDHAEGQAGAARGARRPHAFTVVLRTPPPQVLRKWVLATDNGRSHLIPMPGVTADIVNAFLDDMTTETGNSP